eukprot:TRINITY_DN5530_c0_g2_i1.p1 TRINITY_DN5530_c0_g2~~TRINITY_DN5530_c0_g2_i1.p1  ORF type:complete len:424 (-),score=83.96 TRINITY_DN5530_c0_g2_i1:93-1364(-)
MRALSAIAVLTAAAPAALAADSEIYDTSATAQDADQNFNCESDPDTEVAQHAWSDTKKEYCCRTVGLGCPSSKLSSSSADPLDSTVADTMTSGELSNSDAVVVSGGHIYNCQEGLQDVTALWDLDKQAHCCSEKGLGCPDNAFDCDAGYINWVHGWSAGKKVWCCARTNRGCPPTTRTTTTWTTTIPPCNHICAIAGVAVTCKERMLFASVHTFLGEASPCQLAVELVRRECSGICEMCSIHEACLGAADVETTTLAPTTSAAETNAPAPFDCQEGLSNWQMTWFPAKQNWCCTHEDLGCPDAVDATEADGDGLLADDAGDDDSTAAGDDAAFMGGFRGADGGGDAIGTPAAADGAGGGVGGDVTLYEEGRPRLSAGASLRLPLAAGAASLGTVACAALAFTIRSNRSPEREALLLAESEGIE